MKKGILLLCLAASSAALVSCSKKPEGASGSAAPEAGPRVKLAILAPGASDFWSIVKAGADKASKEFDVDCEVRMPSSAGASEQKAILEDLLSRGIDGLALAPFDPANQGEDINNAAAKTNLICTDTDAPKSNRLCYVGTNNYEAGKVAGQLLKKALPKGGKVFVCVGTLDAQNAADRNRGLRDAVKGAGIEFLGVLLDNADRVKAKANAEDALVTHQDLAAFVGLWSYNGPAIAEAVRAANRQGKVKIICFDEEPTTLQGVKDGLIEATVVQKPFEFGYQSVRVLAALARKQDAGIPAGKMIDTGVQVITKDNVDAFWADLKRQTGKA
jgi:ribose transport system substrate-binding protein